MESWTGRQHGMAWQRGVSSKASHSAVTKSLERHFSDGFRLAGAGASVRAAHRRVVCPRKLHSRDGDRCALKAGGVLAGRLKNSGHAAEHAVRKPFWGLPLRIPLQCKVLERASRFSASAKVSGARTVSV